MTATLPRCATPDPLQRNARTTEPERGRPLATDQRASPAAAACSACRSHHAERHAAAVINLLAHTTAAAIALLDLDARCAVFAGIADHGSRLARQYDLLAPGDDPRLLDRSHRWHELGRLRNVLADALAQHPTAHVYGDQYALIDATRLINRLQPNTHLLDLP